MGVVLMNKISKHSKNRQGFIGVLEVIIILVLLGVIGFGAWKVYSSRSNKSSSGPANTSTNAPTQSSKAWQSGGQAVAGNYADADAVNLGGGKYRLYYSIEPEVTGNKLEVYSATSSDGIKWLEEPGTRKTMATFPDVVKLSDGRYRMY